MQLSVCLLTREPAGRVAALLAPLRALEPEVVVVADARVDGDTLAGYEAIADRVTTAEFDIAEDRFDRARELCRGEWILRLDGDELPSAALVRRLPGLLARDDITQYWLRCRWLFGDPTAMLAELPWSTDYHNRLVRRGAQVGAGPPPHSHPRIDGPAAYVRESFYHLDLVLTDEAHRRTKAIRYEVMRPRLTSHAGGRLSEDLYLPERRRGLRLTALPAEDAAPVAHAIAGHPPPESPPPGRPPPEPAAPADDAPADAAPAAIGSGATVHLRDADIVVAAGATRPVFVDVTNTGDETWPGGDGEPIRLSYRWLDGDRPRDDADGPRTPFPSPVAPGATVLVPLALEAPAQPGRRVMAVDVVHEGVRWFGAGLRVPVTVTEPPPPRFPPLREARRRRRRRAALLFPRIVHRVWLGDGPMSARNEQFGVAFTDLHPGWEMRLWGDDHLPELGITAADRAAARSASELSNIVRYELLRRFGGVYIDTDVECRRSLEPLLGGVHACAAFETPGVTGTAFLGSVPGHPIFERTALEGRRTLGLGAHSADANGPHFLKLVAEQEGGLTVFGSQLFYPVLWDARERAVESFPDAYAVHHWDMSWVPQE